MRFFNITRSLVALMTILTLMGPANATWHESAPKFSGELRDVTMLRKMRPAPGYAFRTGEGESRTLADFAGKVVFLNIWATWCPPCVKEMPSLDRLQAALGGQNFEVLALSLDHSTDLVKKFYREFELTSLGIYMADENAMAAFAVGALPTTLFIGPNGHILGALAGPADWDSDQAIAFARYFINNSPD